ncbi:MAG: hypothetical protein V7681_06585 [Halopseudomonas sabulinigri]|tara:strand:+ start:16323 stop:16589 length:267 start_codon:yes stop_codon:yes gene_type:complete
MAAYVVSYDLNKSGQDYKGLYKELENSPNWWHRLDSTWLIITNETADQLFNRIGQHIDKNDWCLVMPVSKPYSGWLTDDDWQWLRSNI